MKKILFFAIALMSAAMFTACNDTKTPDGDTTQLWYAMEDQGYDYGFINASGKFVIEPQYDKVYAFSCGWCLVEANKVYKFIDKNNKAAQGFSQDHLAGENYYFYYDRLTFKDGDKYGKYDNKFNVVVAPDFYYLDVTADNGYSRFNTKDDKKGYIDKNGKVVIEAKFYGAGDFADGLAVASEKEGDDIKAGVIDANGKYLIEPRKDRRYWNLGEGRLGYREGESLKRGLMDKNGNVLVDPKYDYMYPFSCGLAVVEKDGKYTYIDMKGQELLSDYCYDCTDFAEDVAWVKKESDSRYELINKQGKSLLTLEKGDIPGNFHNGLALIGNERWENTKVVAEYRYINKSGKEIYKWKHEYGFDFAPKRETLREMSRRDMLASPKGYLFDQEIEAVR